jgi:hypothetical protein
MVLSWAPFEGVPEGVTDGSILGVCGVPEGSHRRVALGSSEGVPEGATDGSDWANL